MKTIGRQTERRDRDALFHAETGGSVYFLTFAARPGERFSPAERNLIMQSCKFGHRARWWLFGCVVMPDHVHMLLRPQIIEWSTTGDQRVPRWMAIGEIVKSIKGVTARQIKQGRGEPGGSVWMTDYFERNVRENDDFEVKLEYLRQNPVKAGLVPRPEQWDALWLNEEVLEDGACSQAPPER